MDKHLHSLLTGLKTKEIVGKCDIIIKSLALDSRVVTLQSLFIAVRGELTDGHNYIDAAIENGAVAVVVEQLPAVLASHVSYIVCEDSSDTLAHIASNFYDKPSTKLKLVGVTGTNGKTTTVTLLYDLFRMLGCKVGLLSTVVNKIDDIEIAATHTTPDAISLNRLLAQMVEAGCQYCFMEVSSHSLVQKRVGGVKFAGALFTNITHDHLDYHHSFANYIKAKKMLFDSLAKDSFAIYNEDDRNGQIMVQNCKGRKITTSLGSFSDYQCRIIERHLDGMMLEINSKEVWVRLIGDFNAHNIVGVYAVAVELGLDPEQVLQALSMLKSVAGRFEYVVSSDRRVAIVDYAHTPDALKSVLSTIATIKNGGRVITVVGCGGDRDRTKRPIMAAIATSMSDFTILTSDNPRTECPAQILSQMQSGLADVAANKYITIEDRASAIKMAAIHAQGGDIILVAGKGHESYQEVNGVRHHFDDMEQVKEALAIK